MRADVVSPQGVTAPPVPSRISFPTGTFKTKSRAKPSPGLGCWSVSVMEPPAVVGSPAGQQSRGREPGRIPAELSAALESPGIKALERVNPTAMELGTPRGNAGPSAKQKKSKKRRSRSSLQPCRKVASRDVLGEHRRLPRLRPLYQYINFDMPELMCPSEEKDETLGPAGTATGPELEGELPQAFGSQHHLPLTNWLSQGLRTHLTDSPFAASLMRNPQETWASSALEVPTPALDDKPRQVDTETKLGCTAYLLSPLFIRYPHKLSASCVTTTAWLGWW
ncbi:uncharacterized protein C16orf86 homolog isoform X3 [Anas platyrhynchos]|uniref:uncharacterized protein C16orf86 homolog isoform X3 n=1 Tax=Anas platyrhynchos TaxID=8839 RepID=UPI003AF20838